MSALRFSPGVFLAAFCCAYAVVFALDLPLFRYYPLPGELTWGLVALQDAGPAMAWYGLVASAAIVAAPIAVLVPDRIADRLLRGYLWLFPVALMLVCVFLLRKLFA